MPKCKMNVCSERFKFWGALTQSPRLTLRDTTRHPHRTRLTSAPTGSRRLVQRDAAPLAPDRRAHLLVSRNARASCTAPSSLHCAS